MKLKSLLATAALLLGIALHTVSTPTATAAEDNKHEHEHTAKTGPTNGRLLTEVEPHAEFLITADKKVEIRFVDENNKVVAPGAQVVTVTLGERAKPTKLTFTREGDKLVSDKAIPAGNDYPTVVQIKADAKAKPVNAKFNLNLSKCPTCSNAEYNCQCDHGDDHDHDHKDGDGHDHGKKDAKKK